MSCHGNHTLETTKPKKEVPSPLIAFNSLQKRVGKFDGLNNCPLHAYKGVGTLCSGFNADAFQPSSFVFPFDLQFVWAVFTPSCLFLAIPHARTFNVKGKSDAV